MKMQLILAASEPRKETFAFILRKAEGVTRSALYDRLQGWNVPVHQGIWLAGERTAKRVFKSGEAEGGKNFDLFRYYQFISYGSRLI